jgi:hypothetical protein
MSQAPPYNSIFIPRKKSKKMQHNHVDVEDERVCRSQIENAQKKMRGPGVSDLEESWHFMASNSAALSPPSASAYVRNWWFCA